MTEADWLTSTDPFPMVEFLRGHAGGRRLPLFALACCQRSRDLLAGWQGPARVEAPQSSADKLIREADRLAVEAERQVAWAALSESYPVNDQNRIGLTAHCALALPLKVALQTVRAGRLVDVRAAERALLCRMLRDIMGNPFVPVTIDAAWLTPRVVWLTRAIYDQRTFNWLPKLAEDLEEAGCWNFSVLTHCRGCGPHVRGCWVVDLLLGKA